MAFSDFDPPESWYLSREDMAASDGQEFTWTHERRISFLRWWRQHRLVASDWTQMPDSPLSDAQREEWARYREWLRNLPSVDDSENVVFVPSPGTELVNPWSAN